MSSNRHVAWCPGQGPRLSLTSAPLKAVSQELYSTRPGLPAIPDMLSDVIPFWPKGPKYFWLYAAQWVATKKWPGVWRRSSTVYFARRRTKYSKFNPNSGRRPACHVSWLSIRIDKGQRCLRQIHACHTPSGGTNDGTNVCQTVRDQILIAWISCCPVFSVCGGQTNGPLPFWC